MRQPLRRIAAHYLFSAGSLIPDPMITVLSDGTVASVESVSDRDRLCGVEFYSGILLPGMVCFGSLERMSLHYLAGRGEAVAGSDSGMLPEDRKRDFLRVAEFCDARMWNMGIQAFGNHNPCGIGAADEIKLRSRIEYREMPLGEDCAESPVAASVGSLEDCTGKALFGFAGTDLISSLDALTRKGACRLGLSGVFGEIVSGADCGIVLLSGADYRTMSLPAEAVTRRII